MLTIGLHNALSAKVRRHRDFVALEITAEGHNKITIYCGFAPDEAEAAAAALNALDEAEAAAAALNALFAARVE